MDLCVRYGALWQKCSEPAVPYTSKTHRLPANTHTRLLRLLDLKKRQATLLPSFYHDCWLYKGHFKTLQLTARQWMTQVRMRNLKISGQVFKRPERLHHKLFLAKAHLPGSFCRQLWWTLWNGQGDKCKIKVGKHTLTRQPLKVAYPTNLPQFGKRSLTRQLL